MGGHESSEMGEERIAEAPEAVPDDESDKIEVDELLVRQTQLDLEIEKFLEIETENYGFVVEPQEEEYVAEEEFVQRPAAMLNRPQEPEAPSEAEAEAAEEIFQRGRDEVQRALGERDQKIVAMGERVREMNDEMMAASRSNTEAMKEALS